MLHSQDEAIKECPHSGHGFCDCNIYTFYNGSLPSFNSLHWFFRPQSLHVSVCPWSGPYLLKCWAYLGSHLQHTCCAYYYLSNHILLSKSIIVQSPKTQATHMSLCFRHLLCRWLNIWLMLQAPWNDLKKKLGAKRDCFRHNLSAW